MGNCNVCVRPPNPEESKPKKTNQNRKLNPFTSDFIRSPARTRAPKDAVIPTSHQTKITDKYILGRELGRGEFGITYLCTDRESREALACKSISKRKLRTAVDVEDVRREVSIMSTLPDHPNVVKLRATYEDGESVHLVMELCEGGELFDRIVARGHYTERAAAGVARTIAEVVMMCHVNGVVHRDLKPENFLFANKKENSALKAIDFGLSVFFKPGKVSIFASRLKQFSMMNRFKKKVLRVIAEHLSIQEVEVIKDMFSLMDEDNDGRITYLELKAGLQKVGSQLGEPEIKMLMEVADVDGNGFLDYGEFVAVIIHLQKIENDELFKLAFMFFDKDGSTYIELDELREALTDELGEPDVSVLNDIMREVDSDKDGRINYDEFVTMMKAGTDWRKASRQYSRERFKSLSINLMKDGSLHLHDALTGQSVPV
ncbi:hypothetical protein F2Q68_00042172 [Brassica cretica]|uniref:non-specific serine/threonine protein kinase n=1 Tax=Brassica cretica TaxID=69181 RepID=A0A8S9MLW3_BRACR|nr:hypothetical protein F2Q68_00042172 [Brassica cretica]